MNNKLRDHWLIIAGIVMIAFGVFLFVSTANAEKRCTETATATVVEYTLQETESDGTTSRAYYPVVEYMAGSTKIKAMASSGSSDRPYELNSTVSIRYNPDDPYEFVFEGDKSGMKWGIYCIVVAVALIVLDILIAKGVIKATNVSHGRHYDSYSSGQGITIDAGSISRAKEVFSAMSDQHEVMKNMTAEERKAYYEAVEKNPEILVSKNHKDE